MVIELNLTKAEADLLKWISNFNDVVKYPDDEGKQSETMESLGYKIRYAMTGASEK